MPVSEQKDLKKKVQLCFLQMWLLYVVSTMMRSKYFIFMIMATLRMGLKIGKWKEDNDDEEEGDGDDDDDTMQRDGGRVMMWRSTGHHMLFFLSNAMLALAEDWRRDQEKCYSTNVVWGKGRSP